MWLCMTLPVKSFPSKVPTKTSMKTVVRTGPLLISSVENLLKFLDDSLGFGFLSSKANGYCIIYYKISMQNINFSSGVQGNLEFYFFGSMARSINLSL